MSWGWGRHLRIQVSGTTGNVEKQRDRGASHWATGFNKIGDATGAFAATFTILRTESKNVLSYFAMTQPATSLN